MLRSIKSVPGALVILGCTFIYAAPKQQTQPSGVLFENIHIFNGTSNQLSAPANVLVVGNVIKAIPNKVADVAGVSAFLNLAM